MSGLGLGLGLGLGVQRKVGDSTSMILVYAIPAPSTPIELAIKANSGWFSAEQEVVIDWGDCSANETVSATSDHTGYIRHTYADAGTYAIKISGSLTMYGRSAVNIAGQTLLTRVDSFGKLGLTSLTRAFRGCTGLTSVPETLPSVVENMSNMFDYCSGDAFNPDVSKWDVSNVKDMQYMFRNCYGDAFNPDVSNWNVSDVTTMSQMFYNCYGDAFNPDMKSWTLKTGVTTTYMFTGSRTQTTEWLDELLVAWAANPEQGSNITIDFSPNSFTEVEGEPLTAVADALATLEAKGWNITTANPYPAT